MSQVDINEQDSFDESEIQDNPIISDEVVLSITQLKKSFKGLIAVNNISFDVKKGELVGIIGPNGAGKTTLFNLITGFLKYDTGQIMYKNTDISKKKPAKIAKLGIVRTFQQAKPFKFLSTQQNTSISHTSRNFFQTPANLKNRAIWSLITVDLAEKKNYPAVILSHGDLKRLEFARAMALKPDILLLDEPFAGLSAEEAFRVERLIKEARKEGMTAIIVEHKLHILMRLVNRVIVINQGKILADGPPEEIVKNEEVISAYLGSEVKS
jgi:branched-chain amino acid transport system ATP-binding protein